VTEPTGPDSGPPPVRLVTLTFLALAAATLVFYVASGIVIVAAPLFGARSLGLSKAEIGIAIAVFSVAALALRPVVGWVTDRFGRRFALRLGAALTILALLAHIPAGSLGWFVLARAMLGGAEAFWLVAAIAAAADLAPDGRRGEALSLISLTLYVGLAIGPAIAEAILAATGSFAAVWLVTAAVAAIALGLAWIVPDIAPEPEPESDERGSRAARSRLARLIHPAGLLPGLVILLGLSGMAYYLTFLPLYVRTIGVGEATLPLAEYGLIVVGLRIVGARLPDRFGAVALSGSALAASALGLAIVAAFPSLAGLLVGTALFAFGVAFIMPALLALTVARAPVAERGMAVGTATLFIDVSFGIAPVVLGAVAEVGGYALGFVVAGLVSAMGGLVLIGLLRSPASHRPAAGAGTLQP
jgi:predicted MFS family arabinose efflux permease